MSSEPPSAARASATDDSAHRDRGLLHRLRADDASALDELLALYWAPLLRYALRVLESVDGAEDVAQEAFILLWQRRHACRGAVRAYLYRAVRNLALNQKRHGEVRARWAGRIYRDRMAQPPPMPDEVFEGRALAAAVDRALDELPERRREVFVLIRYHGLSYQETAEVMGISPQTVANQMSAALAALRRSLAPCMAAPPRPALHLLRGRTGAAASDPRASTG